MCGGGIPIRNDQKNLNLSEQTSCDWCVCVGGGALFWKGTPMILLTKYRMQKFLVHLRFHFSLGFNSHTCNL